MRPGIKVTPAFVVASGGTAYAATKIGSAEIRDNSIRGVDIRSNEVRSSDVKDGALQPRDFAPGTLTSGSKGEKQERADEGDNAPSSLRPRYEIENDLKDKVLVMTSISPTEGKTLLTLSLAFAWKMTNKRILLIDGNFTNPEITNSANPKVYLEDFFKGEANVLISDKKGAIDILCNRGGDTSLLELASHEQIRAKLDWAKLHYDLIIIETAALDDINQSKEWMLFTQDIVGVFEAGQTITEQKKNYISYLKGTGFFMGWVMNKITTKL